MMIIIIIIILIIDGPFKQCIIIYLDQLKRRARGLEREIYEVRGKVYY